LALKFVCKSQAAWLIIKGNIFLLLFVGELDLHRPLQLGAN
jgi:hypothetical protein